MSHLQQQQQLGKQFFFFKSWTTQPLVHLYKCPVYVSSFSPTPDLSALHSYMKLSGNTTLPTCAADGLPKYSNWHWQQT